MSICIYIRMHIYTHMYMDVSTCMSVKARPFTFKVGALEGSVRGRGEWTAQHPEAPLIPTPKPRNLDPHT